MEAEVFLDAAYAIALASRSDQYHGKAVAIAAELQQARTRLVTTDAVLLEIGNALSKQRFRSAAVQLLESLHADATVEIVGVTEEVYRSAFDLFRERPDKEWGLTDCASFVVMTRRGIREALTSDAHFQQAGFSSLLLES